MILRPLGRADLPFLVSVRDEFSDAWNENMLVSAFCTGNFYGFIAEDDTLCELKPVGFITYSVNGDCADLQDLFVAGAFRRKGIGKALISEFLCDAKFRGAQKLFLEVRESNLPAINLYLSMGFNKLSVRKKYYSDGENALVLVKEF